MKRIIMPLMHSTILLSSGSTALAQNDDWIGLNEEPLTLFGYAYSMGQDNSDSHRLTLYHELDSSTDVNLQYSRNTTATDTRDFDYDDVSGQLSFLADDNLRLGISYQYQGEEQELEITNLGLLGSYTWFPYSFSFEYREGNLDVFTQREITSSLVPDQINSDMHSQHYSFNWFYQDYGIYLNHQRFHYQKNIAALNTQPLLQAVIKPGALANSGLLLSDSSSAGITWYLDQRELSWLVSSTRYEVDSSRTASLLFEWRETQQDLSVSYSAGITDESSDNLSFGIGFEWNV
jgi:hypothetical protein